MSLKKNILATIKKEHIEPISLWAVKRKKYLILTFFALLIWLGIFIVSFFISDTSGVIEFVEMDTLYILLAWIVVILGLGVFIYRDSKNIGTLYRYSMGRMTSAIFFTLILGWLLVRFSGVDTYIQKYLIKYTGYENIMSTYVNWEKPEQWRLIWEITKIWSGWVSIVDTSEKVWEIIISKEILSSRSTDNEEIIEVGNTIKITWTLNSDVLFTASGITLLFE